MAAQIARRAALSVGVFVLMAALTFLGVEALPGDACTSLLGRTATPEKLAQCRAENGLDRPVLTSPDSAVRKLKELLG